jgi:protein-tyrosine-phosphatase
LLENGINAETFKSTKLTEKALREAFAVVCMTEAQRDEVSYMRWKALNEKGRKRITDNVHCFSEFCGKEVPDPYGYGLEEYRYVFALMESGVYALMDKFLKKELKALLEKEGGVVEATPKKKKKTADKA